MIWPAMWRAAWLTFSSCTYFLRR